MKIKFGSIVTAGSGKIGGHVAAKNRGGAYMRTKVSPSNPSTPSQMQARALFSSYSTGWSALTQAQRDSFINAVDSFKTTDIFGDLRSPSGMNLYVKLNANASNGGFPAINIAPAKVEIPFSPITSAVLTPVTGALTVNFGDTVNAGSTVIIWATPPMSQGVQFSKNYRRIIGKEVVAAQKVTLTDEYLTKFGPPTADDNIEICVQVVVESGQTSALQSIKASV